MLRKKIYLLVLGLALALWTGCRGIDEEALLTSSKALGRYIEIDVSLPEEIQNRNLKTVAIIKNRNNNQIEIYTKQESGNDTDQKMNHARSDGIQYLKYTMSRYGIWNSTEVAWEGMVGKDDKIQNIQYGLDGKLYVHLLINEGSLKEKDRLLCIDQEENVKIMYDSDQNVREIKEKGEKINGFTALEDGRLVIWYKYGKECVIYDDKLENRWLSFQHYGEGSPGIGTDTISVIGDSKKAVSVYNLNNGLQKYTAKYSDNYLGEDGLVCYKEGKGTYLFNTKGVHFLANEGFLWETLLEGKKASMGMPIMEMKNAFMGEEGDFYIYYESNEINVNNGTRLKHYVYDENSQTVPDQILTIYSLYENDLINQAIGYFQNENPGVYINYKVVIPNKETVDILERGNILSENEYIQILDKEIMEGDSADIIVCDKLPLSNYIDEGVFEDMEDVLWPMVMRDELFSMAAQCYRLNNGIYAVPLRFEAYALVGDRELVEHATYLNTLIQYAKENEFYDLVASDMDWQGMIDSFYYLYANEFIKNDGRRFVRHRLLQFLKQIKELDEIRSKDRLYGISKYFSSNIALKDYSLGRSRIANTSIRNILDFRELEGILEYRDGEVCKIMSYKPLFPVGVHHKSTNKELAKQFVKTLLSMDVQKQNYPNDIGITMNKQAFVEWLQLEEVWDIGIYDYNESGKRMGEKIYEYIHIPTGKRRDWYLDWFQNLQVPLFMDQENIKVMKEEAKGYFEGPDSAEETVERIMKRIAQ